MTNYAHNIFILVAASAIRNNKCNAKSRPRLDHAQWEPFALFGLVVYVYIGEQQSERGKFSSQKSVSIAVVWISTAALLVLIFLLRSRDHGGSRWKTIDDRKSAQKLVQPSQVDNGCVVAVMATKFVVYNMRFRGKVLIVLFYF